MAYKIAVGTSDGVNVDLKFGEVTSFTIYEVDGLEYKKIEDRTTQASEKEQVEGNAANCNAEGCKSDGCSGNGHRCGGGAAVEERVTLIDDCRCVVCKKVGVQAQKQFERKTISVFDIECSVAEALEKISAYFNKIDNNVSLRRKV